MSFHFQGLYYLLLSLSHGGSSSLHTSTIALAEQPSRPEEVATESCDIATESCDPAGESHAVEGSPPPLLPVPSLPGHVTVAPSHVTDHVIPA